ncbi:Hypothetical predicted protein [Mytilus galloprovincialis]|uniref:Ig-like domain-containing protein n=1 Tax=Mytilus galloprovincialis TaxID=29158 RepID=A0A8B6CVY5_MYTGA|nr:Hypothetical predicted protein [Mytilus galloprovincialis]
MDINKSEIIYVTKSSNLTIRCPLKLTKASFQWSGPPNLTSYSDNSEVNPAVKGVGISRDINKSEIIYVAKSSNLTIRCPFKSTKASFQWSGPPNLTSYSDNSKVNPAVKGVGISRGRENGKYNLIIYGFEESNEGVYQCLTLNDGKPVIHTFNFMLQINKLSPDKSNCTSVISITDSFTSTDQMHNENHQENTSGITRSEILLCCALVCILFFTMISYARNRHFTARNINIIGQHNDNAPTDQRALETESIHLYNTADDYSVHVFPDVGNGSMQGDDNDLESNSSLSSSMYINFEEDYIHPYDIPLYSFQDNKHDYEKLVHPEEYCVSVTHNGNDDEISITSTEINCSSITPRNVQIRHENIVRSSASSENKICEKYKNVHQCCDLTNIHIIGTNANTKNINQSSNCDITHHKHHVFDDISLD